MASQDNRRWHRRIKRQVQGRLKIATIIATPRQTTKARGIGETERRRRHGRCSRGPYSRKIRHRQPRGLPLVPRVASCRSRGSFPISRKWGSRLLQRIGAPGPKFIPKAAQFSDIAGYRRFLSETLPFNAVATRKRNAKLFDRPLLPRRSLHRDLAIFAAAAERHDALGDVLFYLTCRTEKMVAMVAESLIWPSLADGGLPRAASRTSFKAHFPQFRSANEVSSAIVRTYTGFGVATATRTRMNVSQRQGHLAALAYIMHLEFPELGMYSFDKLLDGPMHKWLLWDRKWIAEQLYMLRHFKLLSKVSEIDNIRQFTTKYSLAEAVEHILPFLKEEQP